MRRNRLWSMTTFFAPSVMLTPERPVPSITERRSRTELAQRGFPPMYPAAR